MVRWSRQCLQFWCRRQLRTWDQDRSTSARISHCQTDTVPWWHSQLRQQKWDKLIKNSNLESGLQKQSRQRCKKRRFSARICINQPWNLQCLPLIQQWPWQKAKSTSEMSHCWHLQQLWLRFLQCNNTWGKTTSKVSVLDEHPSLLHRFSVLSSSRSQNRQRTKSQSAQNISQHPMILLSCLSTHLCGIYPLQSKQTSWHW